MTPADFAAIGHATGVYQFMNLRWSWPAIESLHFLGLAVLIGTVGLFDLRMLGFAKSIPLGALHRLVPLGVAAYLSNAATGAMFFLTFPDQYLYNPAFQVKLGFMLVAGLNVVVFYATAARAAKATPAGADPPWPVKLMALVSLGAWLAVITAGRLITVYRPPEHWCFWC